MIAIRDILIFLSGIALYHVAILTRNYLYGKRISVSGLTQREEAYKPRKINTKLPSPDTELLSRLVAQINTIDEFDGTHSSRLKGRED
jgi:hypothetical protein